MKNTLQIDQKTTHKYHTKYTYFILATSTHIPFASCSLQLTHGVRVSSRNFTLGGKLMDRVALQPLRAGEGCASSRAERGAKNFRILGPNKHLTTHIWK